MTREERLQRARWEIEKYHLANIPTHEEMDEEDTMSPVHEPVWYDARIFMPAGANAAVAFKTEDGKTYNGRMILTDWNYWEDGQWKKVPFFDVTHWRPIL